MDENSIPLIARPALLSASTRLKFCLISTTRVWVFPGTNCAVTSAQGLGQLPDVRSPRLCFALWPSCDKGVAHSGEGQGGTTELPWCSEPPGTRTPQDSHPDYVCFSLPPTLPDVVTGVVQTKPNQTHAWVKSNSSQRNLPSIRFFFLTSLVQSFLSSYFSFFNVIFWWVLFFFPQDSFVRGIIQRFKWRQLRAN